jgi:hypothetical protein
MENKNPQKRNPVFLIVIILMTVFSLAAVVPGVWFALMSLMIFDSGTGASLVLMYTVVAAFPVMCVAGLSSWIFFAFKKHGIALLVSLLPVFNIILVGVLMLVSELFFGGSLSWF